MRWTIRTAAASLALAAVVVLGPAPLAFAAQPPPPAVDPARSLPSTVQRAVVTSAGGIGDDTMKVGLWLAMQMRNAKPPVPGVPPASAPAALANGKMLTGPAVLARGGGLMLPFTAGWMLTDGVLAMYGTTTGTDPMQGACAQPDIVQVGIGVLYPFSMPDCTPTITDANADAGGPPVLTYGGYTIRKLGSYRASPGSASTSICLSVAGSVPTGYILQRIGGNTSPTEWLDFAPGSQPPAGCTTGSNRWSSAHHDYVQSWSVRMRDQATGAIVSTMASPTSNPNRSLDCRLGWPDGTTTTGSGGTYTEGDGMRPESIDRACREAFVSKPGHGPGLLPSTIDIGSTREDTGARTELATQDVPDFTESERKGLTAGNGTGLVLSKVVNGVADSCMTWAADCTGWWAESNQGTNQDTYRCTYNGEAVGLAECGIYRNTFDTRTQNPTITDPDTGESVQWGSSPRGNNSTSPGGAGDVGPGQQCMDEWSSAPNPIEWVFHPIKCALVWAFVPRASVTDNFRDGIGSAWNNSTVGAMAVSLSGLPAIFSTEAGCAGLPFDIDFFGIHFQGRLFEACSEPWAGVATVVRNIISGVILVGGFLAILRYGAGVFGFVGLGLGVGDHDTHETKGVRFK